jgi:hypothetical protein
VKKRTVIIKPNGQIVIPDDEEFERPAKETDNKKPVKS